MDMFKFMLINMNKGHYKIYATYLYPSFGTGTQFTF